MRIVGNKLNQKILRKKQQKEDVLEKVIYDLFEGRERILDTSESKIFLIKIEGTSFSDKALDRFNLKIITPKQMLQRLPIALAQVKPSNTSKNLLNEIAQIIYSLYRAKTLQKRYITI